MKIRAILGLSSWPVCRQCGVGGKPDPGGDHSGDEVEKRLLTSAVKESLSVPAFEPPAMSQNKCSGGRRPPPRNLPCHSDRPGPAVSSMPNHLFPAPKAIVGGYMDIQYRAPIKGDWKRARIW